MGPNEVQKGLGLSSASVAQYHIKKLVQAGLVREESGGYIVDRIIFENMIRIGRSLFPIHLAYIAFFATAFLLLLIIFKPSEVTTYYFALVLVAVALVVFAYEAYATFRGGHY